MLLQREKGNGAVYKIGIFSVTLLVAFFAVYFYSPVVESHADSSSTADINLSVNPGIGIRTSLPEVAMNATIGSFVHNSVDVDVITNSQYGYTLTLEDKDSSSDMTATGIPDVLSSNFSGKKTSSELEDNTWGFSLNVTDYYKVPVNGSPVALKRTNTIMTAEYETTTVDFGAKVGMNLTAGTYSDVVVFTAYVNGQDGSPSDGTDPSDPGEESAEDDYDSTGACTTTKTLHDITTMQRMSTCICQNTTTPNVLSTTFDWDGSHHNDENYVPRTVLRDTRDNNTYLVSKLADGNCWMSQNLGLDLKAGVALTKKDTDLNSKTSFTPVHSTYTNETDLINNWPRGTTGTDSDTADYSYHPIAGDRYYVNGTTKSSAPTSSADEYKWESAGNYYNWIAATAGSGVGLGVEESSVDSICPKGWTLPIDISDTELENITPALKRSYYYLNHVYNPSPSSMMTAPLNFVRAGYYFYISNFPSMLYQGEWGHYWTSTSMTGGGSATSMFFYNERIHTRYGGNYGFGESVRCVAR